MSYRCANKQVHAILITTKGNVYIGRNDREYKTGMCPRVVVSAGHQEMYHLCNTVCGQKFHAEIDALNQARGEGVDIAGSAMYIFGHTKCCDNCKKDLLQAGVAHVFFSSQEGWKEENIKG